MPQVTSKRALGFLVAAMWTAQCISIAVSIYLSTKATDVPSDAWVYLWIHIIIAIVGVGAGVLMARGNSFWKWVAVVSGLAFLAITDFSWYSLATREQGYLSFFVRNPRIGFGVLVMPPFVLLVSFVAAWSLIRDGATPHRSKGGGI